MYVPSTFAETRLDVLHEFIRAHDFATVITAGPCGMLASHVPVVLKASPGEHGVLQMHLAKPNVHWESLARGEDALAIFQGPHGYISPRWYVSNATVPTWNYIVVHAYGTPRLMSTEELRPHLDELVATYESRHPDGWDTGRLPDGLADKLQAGIVGIEFSIKRVEGKWKLGQNRTRDDRVGAIAGLRAVGDAANAALADVMQSALDRTAP
jgi:transcriptional regulator